MGLAIADADLGAVPGNHDHWRGKRGKLNYLKGPPAFTPSVFGNQFRQTPWTKRWVCPNNTCALDLFGLDSNSGFDPKATNRRATGIISATELQELENHLKYSVSNAPQFPVARAIVCHHSLGYDGKLPEKQELDQGSRDNLIQLAGKYRVAAILTGHTHDFNETSSPFQSVDSTGSARNVYELRSASTVAINQNLNGFWMHRIAFDNGTFEWRGWKYTWKCDDGKFVREKNEPNVKFSAS